MVNNLCSNRRLILKIVLHLPGGMLHSFFFFNEVGFISIDVELPPREID